MTALFRADRRGRPTAVFDPVEVTLLRGLVAQLVELVEDGQPVATGSTGVADWAAELGLADVGEPGPTAPPEDAVLRRLLPDAYGPDPGADPAVAAESSAEFRRLTENGLRRTKTSRARLVLAALHQEAPVAGGERRDRRRGDAAAADAAGARTTGAEGADDVDPVTVRLEPDRAQAWLTVLTDLRLALATRLGIVTDEDATELEVLARAELARLRRARRRLRAAREDDAETDPRVGVYQVYSWLGYLQETLVESLS